MKTSKLLRRFVPYYRNYVGIMVMDLFCAALTTVCELVLPLILRYITNIGMNDLASLTVRTIVTIGGVYFVLRIIDGMASFYMAYTGHVMGASIETDMREDAFAHLQKLSDNYFNNTKVGQIMSRITSDLFDVTEFAHHCPEEFFIAFLKAVVSFVILAGINPLLTVIIFVLIPVMAVSCSYFNLQVRKAFKKQRNHIGELNARIEDSLLGNKVVRAFANEDVELGKFNRDNQEFLKIKRETYKYMAAFQNTIRIFEAYDSLPAQLAKDTKKFQYKLIKSGARTSQYGDAIDWLIRSGIVHKCVKSKQGFFPIAAYQDLTAFKLYYSDMGIMSARIGMSLEAMTNKETEHFRGILTENYVSIALKTNGYDLHYWESDSTAEVDFLIQKDSHVIPVECKAGEHVKAKSLMVYMEKYEPTYAIRISTRNFGFVKGIKAVPLYSVFCI